MHLVEIDARLDETHWFKSQKWMPYTVKSDVLAPEQVERIQAVVNAMETALFGADYRDPVKGYAGHLDVEALVDFYLINEYLRNNDAFYSSTYVTRQRGGKLKFGPLWDFDLAKMAIPIGRPQAPAPPASVRGSVRPTPRQGQ